jgi:hypothetical protein
MALNIPTTEEIKNRNLANLELAIAQTSPLADKAFLRVLSGMEALNYTELYKLAVERALQNLALTANLEGLKIIGTEFGVIFKTAEAAVLTIELPATDGTVVPATVAFVGDSNGIRYFPDSATVASGGVATISVTAETSGVAGNLNVSDTLTISTQVPGAESSATVLTIDNTGAEEEATEVYRQRVLFAERVQTGGGNAADYTIWSEEVAGVTKAYVFAGKPFDVIGTSFPGDRTIYIQADTTIDPDGIAPTPLLDEVRAAVNNNPVTGLSRPPLGLIDDTLFIESIVRTEFYVEIRGLDVDADIEAQVKSDIEDAITQYFINLRPFVEGVDIVTGRNDTITTVSVSDVVQDVVGAAGGSANEAEFGTVVSVFVSSYTLDPNELAKLATDGITYVA